MTNTKNPQFEIAPCGHFAYRNYWDAPDDYGCIGCDSGMPPDSKAKKEADLKLINDRRINPKGVRGQ